MSNLRKAAEQALEALEDPWKAGAEGVADAIVALRTALAEPQGKPLPDEAIDQIAIKCLDAPEPGWNRNLARAIEWAHGIR